MISKLKNYILWPVIAILLGMAIYLSTVFGAYKILSFSNFAEEILWKYLVGREVTLIEDNRVQHLQNIIDNLPKSFLPEQYSKIDILVSKNDEVNAFAAPGGRIILTTALLNNVKQEDSLVFVIAHELAHLKRKDHLYEFTRIIVSNLYKILWQSDLVSELFLLIDHKKLKEAELIADRYAALLLIYKYGNINGAYELFKILENYESHYFLSVSSNLKINDRIANLGSVSVFSKNGFL